MLTAAARRERTCRRPAREANGQRGGGVADHRCRPSAGCCLLFVIPTLIVFAIAFKPTDPYGGIGAGWTLRHAAQPGQPELPGDRLAHALAEHALTTALCIVWPCPSGYFMARAPDRRWRQRLLLLVIVPVLDQLPDPHLRLEGAPASRGADQAGLVAAGPRSAPTRRCSTRPGAVLLVMVYTFLPFAILPDLRGGGKIRLPPDRGGARPRRAPAPRLLPRSSFPASGAACSPPSWSCSFRRSART